MDERTAELIAEVKTAVLNQFANRAERWRKLIQLTTFDARLTTDCRDVNEHSTSIACYRHQATLSVVLADGIVQEGFSEIPLRQRVKAPGDY